jgi:hypothetical protein
MADHIAKGKQEVSKPKQQVFLGDQKTKETTYVFSLCLVEQHG